MNTILNGKLCSAHANISIVDSCIQKGLAMDSNMLYRYAYTCPVCGYDCWVYFYTEPYKECTFTSECGYDLLIRKVDNENKTLEVWNFDDYMCGVYDKYLDD